MLKYVPFLCGFSMLLLACGGDDGGGVTLNGDDNVGGVIVDTNGPVAGATITVLGDGTNTTSRADGTYSIKAPSGEIDFLVEAAGHWGAIRRGRVPADENVDYLDLDIVTDGEVTEVATALARTIPKSTGVVIAEFTSDGASLAGSYVVIKNADNDLVATDAPFTLDDQSAPVETDSVIDGTLEVPLIFTGVPVGEYEVLALTENTSLGCASEFDTVGRRLPVRAGAISFMSIYCGSI